MGYKQDKNSKLYQTRQEGLHKLRYILQQVEAKKLEHKQSNWHCGTAHCIFGWLEVFELSKKVPLRKLKSFDFDKRIDNHNDATVLTVGKTRLRLADDIVEDWQKRYRIPNIRDLLHRIYGGDAQFPDQFDALEELEIHLLGSVQKVTKNPFIQKGKATVLTREQINFQAMMEGLKSICEVPVCEIEQVIETVQEVRA